jgi:serine/threonine protein kinase
MKSEIKRILTISHANLLPILGACLQVPNISYFVEYSTLGNLETIIFNPDIEMSPERSLKIAYEVSSGLTALHEAKPSICHGNLKTVNVLVFGDAVKLSYWGFKDSYFQSRVSQPYTLYNPGWLCPEIV